MKSNSKTHSEGLSLALREGVAFFSPHRGVCLNLPFTGDLDNCHRFVGFPFVGSLLVEERETYNPLRGENLRDVERFMKHPQVIFH